LGLGLGGVAAAACGGEHARRPGAGGARDTSLGEDTGYDGPDTGSQGTDTGSQGTDTGSPAPLADTGPVLEDRVPASLCTGVSGSLDVQLELLSGSLPTDLSGYVWFVHGTPAGDGDPVFLGDGQLNRISLPNATLRRRTLVTPCKLADEAVAGTSHAFENSGMARMSMSLGVRNLVNTGVVPLGERLLVTFDAGRPWEIDPHTMEAITPVGSLSQWRAALPEWMSWFIHWPFPLLMSSAHPAVDPDSGELFSVAYGLELLGSDAFLEVVGWDGSGPVRSWEVEDTSGSPVSITQSVHQLVLTRDHLVICDTSFLVEVDLLSDEGAQAQSPDSVFWIIARKDMVASAEAVVARKLVIPREVTHFLADFDDGDGRIVLHVAHNPGADPSEFLEPGDEESLSGAPVRSDLYGLPAAPTDLGALARYEVDVDSCSVVSSEVVYDEHLWGGPALVALGGPDAQERIDTLWWCGMGFAPELRLPRIETLYADHPYREVPLHELPEESKPATLVRVDTASATVVDHYAFPAGRVCLSPTFVPRTDGAQDEGYILCTMISDDTDTPGSSGDELWLFDAQDLAQGPLARLGHPDLDFPFTLHTAWTPTAQPRTASYQVDIRSDLEGEVSQLDAELQAVFEDSVYPAFDS